MENFVLYDELGKGDHYTVYKGRRKNTINFLSIHCADKCKRAEITNMVRLIHEMDHRNVLKFYEWYETTNHLWLIVELCTGGSLQTIISQDERLPESSICKFGLDLVEGLHHIHSLGIIFSDIKPSKILLDGCGNFKFADFGLSRVDGENLDALFDSYVGEQSDEPPISDRSDRTDKSENSRKKRTLGTLRYLAPELLNGAEHSIKTDFWALGCVFHEMFTGQPLFQAENFTQLRDKILHEDIPPPKVKGPRGIVKPSTEFQSLLSGLIERDPSQRMDWGTLVMHPFWQGSLLHLARDLEDCASVRASVHQSISQFSGRASVVHEFPACEEVNTAAAAPVVHTQSTERSVSESSAANVDKVFREDMRLIKDAGGGGDAQVIFTLSARPYSTVCDAEQSTTDRSAAATSGRTTRYRRMRSAKAEGELESRSSISALIYHSTDFTATPILNGNNKGKAPAVKFDAKLLPVPSFSADKILSLSEKDQEKHCQAIMDACSVIEKGQPSQRYIQLLNYVTNIATKSVIANGLVQQNLLTGLANCLSATQNVDLKLRLSRTIGIVASHITELEPSVNLQEIMAIVTEVLKDNFKNTKVKQAVLPAFGELLVMISSQELIHGKPVENWTVPPVGYNLIVRCLRDTEDSVVNLYAARIIENIATRTDQHAMRFATTEVGQQLWYVFTHAALDNLRITSLSALARLTRHSVGVFQSVLDKVGLPKLLEAMSLPIARVQQAFMTMFATLIHSDAKFTSIAQEKEFLQSILRALDSPSPVIRAKAFLILVEIFRSSNDMLLAACQARLMMYIERDSRTHTNLEAEGDYLANCLACLIDTLQDVLPGVFKQLLTALSSVDGKKHPSTVQIKQLKSTLPLLPIVLHFVNCSLLRSRVINDELMEDIAALVHHVESIDSGSTQIHGATGSGGTEEFFCTVFGILESLLENNSVVVLNYNTLFLYKILPSLATLISSEVGDTRGLSLRLFSEVSAILLDQEIGSDSNVNRQNLTKRFHQIVNTFLLPQFEQVLLDSDPVPSYGLQLLLTLIRHDATFIRDIEKINIVQILFEVIVDRQSNPACNAIQLIVLIFSCIVSRKETNIKDLLEQGFVNHFSFLFLEISALCINSDSFTGDIKSVRSMLSTLLDTLHTMLKYVSDVVRKALDAKKHASESLSRETEQAESLLLTSKPFIDFVSPLTCLLVYDDSDVTDISLKCLSLLVQFYGGEHTQAFSSANIAAYSEVLKTVDAKKQKIILRVIKRMISTDRQHIEVLQEHGEPLVLAMRSVVESASSTAEISLSRLADEVLKMILVK